jgi:hypothetical protein
MPKDNGYCIDTCIAQEVMGLWMKGITTTGCCCGHNEHTGFIGVADSDIEKMKQLGYEVHQNKMRPDDEDSFTPKSIPVIPLENEWVVPVMENYEFVCCDCGLVHEIDFKIVRRRHIEGYVPSKKKIEQSNAKPNRAAQD